MQKSFSTDLKLWKSPIYNFFSSSNLFLQSLITSGNIWTEVCLQHRSGWTKRINQKLAHRYEHHSRFPINRVIAAKTFYIRSGIILSLKHLLTAANLRVTGIHQAQHNLKLSSNFESRFQFQHPTYLKRTNNIATIPKRRHHYKNKFQEIKRPRQWQVQLIFRAIYYS